MDAMVPAEMLRLYAKAGVDVARTVTTVTRVFSTAAPDVRERVRERIKQELLDENALPYTPEEVDEVVAAIFDGACVPELFRGFGACMHLSGETVKMGLTKEPNPQALIDLHWASRWASCGLPIFQLTHGLTAALLLTEPPPFDEESFKLPFPTFAVRVPTEFIPFFDGETKTWGETLFVHHFLGKADGRTQQILQVDVRSRTRNLWHRKPMPEMLSVEREQAVFEFEQSYKLVEDDYRTIEVALRLLRNLVAWVGAHGTGQLEGRPRPKVGGVQRDNQGEPVPSVWVLGREVKISSELRRLAPEIALGERHGGPGWKLRMRYCVRGHWRNQPHGEGRRERKRIWIEPHWRGPEGAAAWAHVYTDDNGETK